MHTLFGTGGGGGGEGGHSTWSSREAVSRMMSVLRMLGLGMFYKYPLYFPS